MAEKSNHQCAYCPEVGADVCVRMLESGSGPGHAILAHRACAEERGVPVLYTLTSARTEHFA